MTMDSHGLMGRVLLVVGAAGAVVLCGALAAGEGTRVSHAQEGIPARLLPPEGQVRQVALLGIGAQVYACTLSATASSGYAWTFVAPAAVLLDASGAIVGTHFAGPTWLGSDGSSVRGEVIERAPSADPSAIPWLLLRGTPAGVPGRFGGVAHIQRLETVGGVAPTDGCDEAHVGAISRVPYSAVYAFSGTP
jgi:Protein of unknown function (DUF3455)